jgi:Domain of unknown function (DUF4352)
MSYGQNGQDGQQWGPQQQGGPGGRLQGGWGAPPPPPHKKRGRLVPILIGAAAFVVVLVIIGAATGGGQKHGTTGSPGNAAAPGSTGASASGVAAKPKAAKKRSTATFGGTYTYTDGLAVTVSKVGGYTPSAYAAGTHPGDPAVVLTVKVTNGTKKAFDTSLLGVNTKAGTDGAAADAIFDDSMGGGFSGTIVPGSSATAKFAFDIPKGARGALDIEVQPDSGLEYASWHWVGPMP